MSKTLMGVGIILRHLNVKKISATILKTKKCVKTVQKHVAIAKVILECKKIIEFNIMGGCMIVCISYFYVTIEINHTTKYEMD